MFKYQSLEVLINKILIHFLEAKENITTIVIESFSNYHFNYKY